MFFFFAGISFLAGVTLPKMRGDNPEGTGKKEQGTCETRVDHCVPATCSDFGENPSWISKGGFKQFQRFRTMSTVSYYVNGHRGSD